jgi:hypothetical protein
MLARLGFAQFEARAPRNDLEAMVDEIEAMGVNIGNMIPKK